MMRRRFLLMRSAAALAATLIAAGLLWAGKNPKSSRFKYAGGTENLEQNCEGRLEVTQNEMTFRCSTGSIAVPYEAITLMEYRPNLSRKVQKLKPKPKWRVRPAIESPIVGKKRNRYFTIVYTDQGVNHVIVLDVSPDMMRPYLAEIDLKSGKRIEVMGFEEYY